MTTEPARNIDEQSDEYCEDAPTVELIDKGCSAYEVVYGAECRREMVELCEVRA